MTSHLTSDTDSRDSDLTELSLTQNDIDLFEAIIHAARLGMGFYEEEDH